MLEVKCSLQETQKKSEDAAACYESILKGQVTDEKSTEITGNPILDISLL